MDKHTHTTFVFACSVLVNLYMLEFDMLNYIMTPREANNFKLIYFIVAKICLKFSKFFFNTPYIDM